MNCQPTWVTQNAIPREQELISLGGGHYDPLPDKVGLNDTKINSASYIKDMTLNTKHKQFRGEFRKKNR